MKETETASGPSLLAIVNTLLRHWRAFLLLPLVLAFLAGAWGVIRDRDFVAQAKFVPQLATPSDSRFSGIAAQLGVNLGAGDGESLEYYMELLRSPRLLEDVITDTFRVSMAPESNGTFEGDLIEYYEVEAGTRQEQLRKAAAALRENVEFAADPAAMVMTIRVTAEWPQLASAIARSMMASVAAISGEYRRERAAEERRFLQGRVEAVRSELRAAEAALSDFLLANRSVQQSPSLQTEMQRLQREVDFQQQLYSYLAQSYEQARIEEMRTGSGLSIIAAPEGWEQPQGSGPVVLALFGFLIGLVLAFAWALARSLAERMRERRTPDYIEFRRLLEEIRRMRRPSSGTEDRAR